MVFDCKEGEDGGCGFGGEREDEGFAEFRGDEFVGEEEGESVLFGGVGETA